MKNSLWAGSRLSAGWICPAGHRMPMHAVHVHILMSFAEMRCDFHNHYWPILFDSLVSCPGITRVAPEKG